MEKKKDKDKRFIKNWRQISLLNTDMKIMCKVLSTIIKNVLAFLISKKNRFVSESRRVISDILEISNSLVLEVILEGFLITVGIEKAFDSVNHCFL